MSRERKQTQKGKDFTAQLWLAEDNAARKKIRQILETVESKKVIPLDSPTQTELKGHIEKAKRIIQEVGELQEKAARYFGADVDIANAVTHNQNEMVKLQVRVHDFEEWLDTWRAGPTPTAKTSTGEGTSTQEQFMSPVGSASAVSEGLEEVSPPIPPRTDLQAQVVPPPPLQSGPPAAASDRSRASRRSRAGSHSTATSHQSVVSEATKKRLQAIADLQQLESQRRLQEKRDKEDEQERRRQFEEDEKARRRQRERDFEDQELRLRTRLSLAQELAMAEDEEQHLGLEDADFQEQHRAADEPREAPTSMGQRAFELNLEMAKHHALSEYIMIGPPKLESFHGDPKDFIPFIRTFESVIGSKATDPHLKLTRLWELLGPTVRPYVEVHRLDAYGGYDKAMSTLWEVFGNAATIASSILAHLKEGVKQFKADDNVGLMKFKMEIGAALSTIEALGRLRPNTAGTTELSYDYGRMFDSQETLAHLLNRLPPFMMREYIASLGREHPGDLKTLHKFLEKKTKSNAHPLYMATAQKDYRNKAVAGNVGAKVMQKGGLNDRGQKRVFMTNQNQENEMSPRKDQNEKSKSNCIKCSGEHFLARCPTFGKMNQDDRIAFLRKTWSCFNCLKPGHLARNCQRASFCQDTECHHKGKHSTLIHSKVNRQVNNMVAKESSDNRATKETNQSDPDAIESVALVHHVSKRSPDVIIKEKRSDAFMGVIPVRLHNPQNGQSCTAFGMLDACANVDVIAREVVDILKLPITFGKSSDAIYTVAGQLKMPDVHTTISISPFGKPKERHTLNHVMVQECESLTMNRCPTCAETQDWDKFTTIVPADDVDIPKVVVLISINHPHLHQPLSVVTLSENGDGMYAVETTLGMALYGGTEDGLNSKKKVNFLRHSKHVDIPVLKDIIMEPRLTKEVYDTALVPSVNERAAYSKMRKGLQIVDGHYQIPIPFIKDDICMPNNRSQAVSCLEGMRSRFKKNPGYFKEYQEAVQKYIDDGHAVRVPEQELIRPEGKTFYLMHHGVQHLKKRKLHVVYNLSKEFKGKSLNGQVIECPDLLQRIVGVLLRFRVNKVAVAGDIRAFFHNIKVPIEHADLMRFVWFQDGDENKPLVEYRMETQVFGGTASQAAAVLTLNDVIIRQNWSEDKKEKVKQSFYSDDFLSSFQSPAEAVRVLEEVIKALGQRGFRLRNFISNDMQVQQRLRQRVGDQDEDGRTEESPRVEVLGLGWDRKGDNLKFEFSFKKSKGCTYTKRECLSLLMSMYDPLGLLTPFTLQLKEIVHELVISEYDWDDEINEEQHARVKQCTENLSGVSKIDIPRAYAAELGEIQERELHMFSDGSNTAYGCAGYLVSRDSNKKVKVCLIYAKNRLCPASVKLTVPKIELSGATMSVKMMEEIKRELHIKVDKIFFWTDSVSVLRYIRNRTKRFQVFVGNRIAEILHRSDPYVQWRYVPTEINPADMSSRSTAVPDFPDERLRLWFLGPEFLWGPPEKWPTQPEEDMKGGVNIEETDVVQPKKFVNHLVVAEEQNEQGLTERQTIEKLHLVLVQSRNFSEMKRKIAWLQKFIQWRVNDKKVGKPSHIETKDLLQSENDIIKISQKFYYEEEFTRCREGKRLRKGSRLYRLCPFFDKKDRIMRVATRLENADIAFNYKYPKVVPKDSHIAHVLVREAHKAVGHQGALAVLSRLRESVWIVGAKVVVNRVLSKCLSCRRYRARFGEQLMANLPQDRLEVGGSVFESTSVDLFGPFRVKRARSMIKRYISLFTCNVTRAVHLEVCYDLSMDSFLQAFRRFVARRGTVKLLRSDQGTNLRAADKEIREAIKDWNATGIG